jgi:uncharacterized protein YkwD
VSRLLAVAAAAGVAGAPLSARGAEPPSSAADSGRSWATESASPVPAQPRSTREAALLARCGRAEQGLQRVAQQLVDQGRSELSTLDPNELVLAMRVTGEPHVWPRAWALTGRDLDFASTLRRFDEWSSTFPLSGDRRCGIGIGTGEGGREAIVAIVVDAMAELSPLPIRARTGQWLSIDATLLVPARSAKVVVLGPSGVPRSVATSLRNGHVRARVAAERPGAFTVQILADFSLGPRPILEAKFFADVEPTVDSEEPDAPAKAGGGTNDGDDARSPDALDQLVQSVRAEAHLPLLTRDRRLDLAALAHARQMAEMSLLAHDLGDGNAAQRLAARGLHPRETGENLAHAPTVQAAHRALHASPSHLSNLLRRRFDRLGVGVFTDRDGSVWVSEIFAAEL